MTVYRLLALRYALHRWDRAALVVASIALGVAALVSARALNQCVETAARETKSPLAVADLSVSNGEALVPHKLAEAIRRAAVPGVKAVSPSSTTASPCRSSTTASPCWSASRFPRSCCNRTTP